VAHRDNTPARDDPCANDRFLTVILYANTTEWEEDWGGYLKLYPGAEPDDEEGDSCPAEQQVKVRPAGGTIVVFKSRELLHEVMPAHKKRMAMSIWLLAPPDYLDREAAKEAEDNKWAMLPEVEKLAWGKAKEAATALEIGDKIQVLVHFTGDSQHTDAEWYNAKVQGSRPSPDYPEKTLHSVKYVDDGSVEELDLSTARYPRWREGNRKEGE
jgi:hypothetical protein